MPAGVLMLRTTILLASVCGLPGCGHNAGTAVDLSTPKATLRTHYEALRDGDVAKLTATIEVRNERGRMLVDLMGRWTAAGARLRRAAVEKFGPLTDDEILNIFPLPYPDYEASEKLRELDHIEVKIIGDHAEAESFGVNLIRVGRVWKLDVPTEPELEPGSDEAMKKLVAGMIAAADETIGDIRAGKLKSAEEARTAVQNWRPRTGTRPGQP